VMPDGTIFSRRMVRDAKRRLEAQENGRKGGNPSLIRTQKPPDKPPDKGVNPPVYPPMKMTVKVNSGVRGGGEGAAPILGADAARLLDETGIGVNVPPHKYGEVEALVRMDGYDSARRCVDEAQATGIGGIAAISYAAKIIAGEKAQKRLRASKSNGQNGGHSAIAVRKDR
jgi:hypothetical protein